MPELAFVAGATGYTGREVVRALRARGVATVAHVRPDSPRLEEWRSRFASLGARTDATPWDGAAMTATLGALHPTLVFALLGTTRARGRDAAARGQAAESYETVDYGLTSLLLRAALASGDRPRFVYLSALGVSAGTSNAYLAARARLEAELVASGLPFVVARPSFVTGPDRDESRPLERGGAVVADAVLGLARRLGARGLAERYASMSGRTLAEALVSAGLDAAAGNRVLDAGQLRALVRG